MIKELANPVTDNYKDFKKNLLSNTMPWFYYDKTTTKSSNKDMPFFSHILLRRPDRGTEEEPKIPISEIGSTYFQTAYLILKEILDFNNINFNIVYRMNLNLTLHSEIKESQPHTDFCLPHKVVIVYLNEFEEGRTIVLNDKNKKFYSQPKENKVIIFDGKHEHYQESPSLHDQRIVMVANIQ
jgi:hypothetical protein|tara:strand:+ start:93 stop:641 length:549 start_codon:yes stop_codon:yes gene_type:complete